MNKLQARVTVTKDNREIWQKLLKAKAKAFGVELTDENVEDLREEVKRDFRSKPLVLDLHQPCHFCGTAMHPDHIDDDFIILKCGHCKKELHYRRSQ